MLTKRLIGLAAVLLSLLVCAPALAGGHGGGGSGIAVGRDQVDPSIVDGTARKELRQARQKWLDRDVRNYRMKVAQLCFCATPRRATVTVRRGKVVRVAPRRWRGPRTVSAVFRVIGQAIKHEAASLDVKYQRWLGFPKRASIDYIAMAADDEITYRIRRLKKL